MLHGFPTWSIDYAELEGRLASSRRVVTFAFLGFGSSDKPRRRYTIAEQADIAEAVACHLDIRGCDVVAHDYGTIVAQELIRRRSESRDRIGIRRLVLLNAGIVFSEYRPTRKQAILSMPVVGALIAARATREKVMGGLARIFGPNTRPTTVQQQDMWYGIALQNGHRLFHRLIHYNAERTVSASVWERALASTDVPTALVWGMADPVSGAHVLCAARKRYPAFSVTELVDIGHYPQVEAPDAVAAAIKTFVEAA